MANKKMEKDERREYLNYLTNLYRQKAAMGENDNNKPGEVIEPDYVLAWLPIEKATIDIKGMQDR